jgi:hypothetical protein
MSNLFKQRLIFWGSSSKGMEPEAVRRIVLALNAIAATLFAFFIAYTFFGRPHVDRLARDFVTEKTEHFAAPTVEVAEQALETKLAEQILKDEQIAQIRAEIGEYRDDPAAYIGQLTGARVPPAEVNAANPLVAKAVGWKQTVRDYYGATLRQLVRDLRIFSGSNLVACLIAFCLAYSARGRSLQAITWFSFLMFAAVVYCSYMYINGLTFFRIIFDLNLGWSYPVLLMVAVIALYFDHGRHSDLVAPEVAPPKSMVES